MPYFGPNHFSFDLKVIWSLKCLNYLVYFYYMWFFSYKIQEFSSCPPCTCSFWSLLLLNQSYPNRIMCSIWALYNNINIAESILHFAFLSAAS